MSKLPLEPLKSKFMFCWLALFTGAIGGHWIYAGRKRFWFYMGSFPVSVMAGWVDVMRFGLMKDEEFNAMINPEYPADTRQTTGAVVTAVALALGAATTFLMAGLAMLFQWYFAGNVA